VTVELMIVAAENSPIESEDDAERAVRASIATAKKAASF
jgi:hypothetical protein